MTHQPTPDIAMSAYGWRSKDDIAAGLRAEVVELHEARATYEAARITLSRAYQAAEQRHLTRIADLTERLGMAARDIERLAAANNALRAENRRLTTARGLPPVGVTM